MDNKKLVKNWQEAIVAQCRRRLGRGLTEAETEFIKSRAGFTALETIEDTVKTVDAADLESYLNSEKN